MNGASVDATMIATETEIATVTGTAMVTGREAEIGRVGIEVAMISARAAEATFAAVEAGDSVIGIDETPANIGSTNDLRNRPRQPQLNQRLPR
jgi:hypothetical protein